MQLLRLVMSNEAVKSPKTRARKYNELCHISWGLSNSNPFRRPPLDPYTQPAVSQDYFIARHMSSSDARAFEESSTSGGNY